MVDPNETKSAKFLRLMQKRLGRAIDEMRLVSQLSSDNYESTEAARIEVVQHLDSALRKVAGAFGVDFSSNVAGMSTKKHARALTAPQVEAMISDLDNGRIGKALDVLKAARQEMDS